MQGLFDSVRHVDGKTEIFLAQVEPTVRVTELGLHHCCKQTKCQLSSDHRDAMSAQ